MMKVETHTRRPAHHSRSVEESTTLIDSIVGRCVRDPEFARAVVSSPHSALAEYELNQGELEDFIALRRDIGEGAITTWDGLRSLVFGAAEKEP